MKLSIIIPIYNVEQYIIDCLSSIYSINCSSDFEIIVVDDCSPDNSQKLIKKYVKENKIENLKLIKHEVNKGLGAARNTGVLNATNPYVWFIDSDDAIDPVQFTQLTFNLHENFDLLLMGVAECDARLNFKKEYIKYDEIAFENFSFEYKNQNLKQLDVVAWNKIIKRDLFVLNPELRFGEGVLNEDEIFSLLLCRYAKKVIFKEELVYLYRIRENSITTSTISDPFFTSWEINFKEAIDFFKDYDVELWKDWFLEKIQTFNRKYSFEPQQLIRLKKLLTPYYSMFPFRFWNTNWRHNENLDFFEDWFEIYRSESKGQPLVSVIIPTYKRPRNLITALESVLCQTYHNIEVIVVNDTGNDTNYQSEYTKLLLPFLDKITYINLPINLGGGSARNCGIERAKGEYICFLDDDDYYGVDRVQNAANQIQKYNSDEIWGVYCGYDNKENNAVNSTVYSGNLSYDILNLNYSEFSLNTDTVFIKKDILDRNQIRFNPKLRRHQDLDLFLKLFNYGFVIGYNSIDVTIKPETSEIGNWLNNEIMHSTKRYFLEKHRNSIACFPFSIQEEIYTKQWNNVIHYYLGADKNEKFKRHVLKSGFDQVNFHEYHFLFNHLKNIESLKIDEALIKKEKNSNKREKLESEKRERFLLLRNKALTEEVEDLLQQKAWYENTYEKLPTWWRKSGSIIRKLNKK